MRELEPHRVSLFREHGFFVVPGFLRPAACARLRRACDPALVEVRATSRGTGHVTPAISLLGRPGLDEIAGSPRVVALLHGLATPGQVDLPRLKDTLYYHEPTARDWDGDWHRDSQFGRPDPELERRHIASTTSVHVRVALVDDDRLEILPGSHARWDTDEELRIRKGSARATDGMPGATRILLAAGDLCAFHAWSIHRATYRRFPVRRTIDCLYSYTPRSAARAFEP